MNAPIAPDSFRASFDGADDVAPIIRLSGVSRVYPARRGTLSNAFGGKAGGGEAGGSVAALTEVDLAVPRGAILGVIGKSGAGKSTLIRLINGLERPSAGRIALDGEDVTALDEAGWRGRRREIGMIFQHFNLLSSRSAAGNVALPLEIAGWPKAAIAARVAELLALVGLSDKADRHPAELSGGQKQRVGIARALATRPKVLLCDEATSALDPETTASILALLRRVNRELGVTIVLITHEIAVVKEICDRVAVIEAGRIVEEGDAFDVLTSPRRPETARLVREVASVEPPAEIAARLRQEPAGRAVLRIAFAETDAASAILAGAGARILAGRVDAVAGRPFGAFVVSIPAADARPFAERLEAAGAATETLGHVH